MGKIAILHTTTATVEPLGRLIRQELPDVTIENFVDDSVLSTLMADSGSLNYIFEKMLCYAGFAERQGASLILNACSSVGEFKDYAEGKLSVPLLRIDDPVSSLAVEMGKNIAVLATLSTTLHPSCQLIEGKSSEVTVWPMLVEGAYSALQSGDKKTHDMLIAEKAGEALKTCDVVYLAQASMADAVSGVPEEDKKKVLFSTGPAVRELVRIYKEAEAGGKGGNAPSLEAGGKV